MSKNGITVYLPADIETLVTKLAREQHRAASNVIAECVRASLRRKAETPEDGQTAAIGRIDARLDKAIRDTAMIKEMVLLFVRVWLEHNPPVEEHLEDAAAASAEARFERFLDYIAKSLDGGRSLAARGANGRAQGEHDALAEEGP
jgi:hypothetical protein